MSSWGERFDYKGFHGCYSHCYIDVKENRVLCTEADDNQGTSITNMAEGIATEVCRKFDIPMKKVIWIEHYNHSVGNSIGDIGSTFDLVTFDIVDDHFEHPKWKHLGEKLALEIFETGVLK